MRTQDYQIIWLSENQDNRKRISGCGRAARHVRRITLIETSCATYKRKTKLSNLLYKRRECSTNRPVFLQNKANFWKSQMDVRLIMTSEYEKKSNWTFGENKPKQSQFRRTIMTCNPSNAGEKIGLTMVYSDIIVLAFNKAMTDTCLTAVKIGAKYG